MEILKALTSFGLLASSVVCLAQIPALRVGAGVNEGTPRVTDRPTIKPLTAVGNFDPQQLRQWDAPPNGQSATSENGLLTIGGKNYRTITNEYTPKGTFVIGKPYYSGNGGFLSYPIKVVFTRDMNPPAREQFLKNGSKLDSVAAYAIHAGKKSNGCIVLSDSDLRQVAPLLQGTTITIR